MEAIQQSEPSSKDDPIPKMKAEAEGISLGKVLYNSGDQFKRFMSSHVKELIKKMRAAKIISKPFTKWIKNEQDSQIDKLLAEMKRMPPDKFVNYLELLLSIVTEEEEDSKKSESEKTKKSEGAVQRSLKDDTKELMRLMKGSLEAMKPVSGSELDVAVSRIVYLVDQDSGTVLGQTTISDQVQVDHSPSPTPLTTSAHPPNGQLGDSVGAYFTNKGGILYSPLHGVTVIIPPNNIPGAIPEFYLSMHFYLLDPFTLEDDIENCSVIVWFYQKPQFHFIKDVTIKIPHAAIVDDPNDDSLCVLTWGQDKQLKLNTKVPADFSDGYHAVFKVNHFCPKTIGRTKKRKSTRKRTSSRRKKLQKMGSSSIEKSIEEGVASRSNSIETGPSSRTTLHHQEAMDTDSPATSVSQDSMGEEEISDMKYSIVCGMPRDRSQGNWNVLFAASYGTPTWSRELEKFVKKEFSTDVYSQLISGVRIGGGYFEFCKENSGSDDNWEIESSISPPEICVESIHEVPEKLVPEIMPPYYPPRVSFEVSSSQELNHSKLKCRIEAQGALTKSGKTISFLINSTLPPAGSPPLFPGERVLQTARYLYGDNSNIIEALTSADDNLVLSILEPDHCKFLADISLQISDKQQLCHVLERPYDNPLDTYLILSNWVASSTNMATVARLKERLKAMKYINIQVCENETKHKLLSPHLEKEYILTHWNNTSNYKLRGDLPQKLQCCWRNIGRLLGILENDFASRNQNSDDLDSYQMLYEWQRREGRGATFGALFKAIHRVYVHDPTHIFDAYLFSQQYVDEQLCT